MRTTARVTWRGNQVMNRVSSSARQAVQDALEYLLQETNKVAPLDTGALIRSGKIEVRRTPKGWSGKISYGSGSVPYAIRLHEHPEYNFQNGRKGKYLEQTIIKNREKIKNFIRTREQEALRG